MPYCQKHIPTGCFFAQLHTTLSVPLNFNETAYDKQK